MFEDTRPADLDGSGHSDAWRDFRVTHPAERVALLRQLRDCNVPVMLSAPGGVGLATCLWAYDSAQEKLNFSADANDPRMSDLVEADEVTAVSYLDSVKLQFELHGLVLVHGHGGSALQSALPREIYRFQRRSAYRVRPLERHAPLARLRHPSIPDMTLALRVLDVSIGGCALWLPHDVPELQPGTRIAEVQVQLDAATQFTAALLLQHVSATLPGERGVRLGCEWQALGSSAHHALQRWIDQAQKRRRLLQLD